MSKMVPPYAVVSFVKDNDNDDQVTSEVPSCWLTAGKQKCWWPKVKNISYLISKQALPDLDNSSKWALHEIVFENYYDTLEQARRRAEVVSSSDERDMQVDKARCRNRKRKSTSLKMLRESSDDEDISSNIKQVKLPSPPSDMNINKTILMEDLPIIFDIGQTKLQGVPRVIAECEPDPQLTEPHLSSKPITKPRIVSSQILHEPLIEIKSHATAGKSQVIVPSAESSSSSNLNISDSDSDTLTPNHFIDELQTRYNSSVLNNNVVLFTPKSSQISVRYSQDSDVSATTISVRKLIENNFDKLFRKVAEISVDLTAVKDSINTLKNRSVERTCSGANIALDMIEAAFPFHTKLEVAKFEADLDDTISQSNVILCLKKVGGSGMKESLIRILRKVFSNQLAKESSWLGQRGNFKVNDLAIMKCIKDAISARYNHTDKEFEEVASEWFRQANQRYVRELAKAAKKTNTL